MDGFDPRPATDQEQKLVRLFRDVFICNDVTLGKTYDHREFSVIR